MATDGVEEMTGSQQMSLLSMASQAVILCAKREGKQSELHHVFPAHAPYLEGSAPQPLTLGPRASRVRARSVLACVSAMSARSSASSSSC